MREATIEVITHAGQALDYSNQALAILDMWVDVLTPDDEMERRRVAAVDTLLREAVSYLEKAREVAA
ncbi:hypothetical protein ACFK06_003256 [Salmonella enterica]|uniref:Uncharacterized protein n=1 Tax=Salmonella enterica subsp. salamae serovar 47:b:1,5 TaxID=1967619 RepID=A0A735MDZ5_SALER|nr:hypothetical protein [Salmonella enterica]ECE6501180.1 hypothetical protein [Salmonella enterica subsp. salamae]EKR1460119.1 hypothetical protein [Salmonella enterica subsp. salamae serovar 47:b:1,5]EAW4167327.1 hypothetical protein [Salmonella enterica]EAW4327837.1 hypothetical protein [Salmonella enterica]